MVASMKKQQILKLNFYQKKLQNCLHKIGMKTLNTERTLEVRGTRHVEALVESQNSLTHFYGVMPLISGNGRLIKLTLIVHETPNGEFGQRMLKSMFQHDSILVLSSTSGKVTKAILQTWATEVCIFHFDKLSVF